MKKTLKFSGVMTLVALSSAIACGGSSDSDGGDGDGDGDGDTPGDGDGDTSGDGDGDTPGDGDGDTPGLEETCDDLECPENARCVERLKGPECTCDEGYALEEDECVDEDDCSDDPCDSGETCVDAEAPDTGYTCETIDACADDPCGDGETCINAEAPDTGYACEDTDGCADDPCTTGELCMDIEAPGTGYMCSDEDGCAGDPCDTGEECTDIVAPMEGYMCSDIDGCDGVTCDAGEECVDVAAPGTGHTCEDVDGCADDPCTEGETCVDAVAPATGYSCEDTDECLGDPCGTGYSCEDAIAPATGYTCTDVDGCADANVECLSGTCVDVAAPGVGYACDYNQVDTMCQANGTVITSNSSFTESFSWAAGTVTDVTLSLDITHTFSADLDIELSHAGLGATIIDDLCAGNDNIDATFSDEGSSVVCGTDPAISGTILPLSPFSAFDGESSQGDWTLQVTDDVAGDGGTLNEWCLNVATDWSGSSTRGNVTTTNSYSRVGCPAGQVLTGFTVWGSSDTDAAQARCGTPTAQGTDPMTVVPGATLETVGATGAGNMTTLACPANQVVVGFEGSVTPSGTFTRDTAFRCAPLDADGMPGDITTTITFGGGGGTAYPVTDCPDGTVATSANLGIYSSWLSAIALGCEAL